MSIKKSPKFYVVRTFQPFDEDSFKCVGQMSNLTTFVESTFEKQYEAIIELICGQTNLENGVHRPWLVTLLPARFKVTDLSGGADLSLPNTMVQIIDFTINTGLNSFDSVRTYHSAIREVIKSWAEKCRVTGVRGWRANAIKTPSFEHSFDGYILRFQVILGTAIFYNENRVTVGGPVNLVQFNDDVEYLADHLNQALDRSIIDFKYNHSKFGKGEVAL